LPLKSGGCNKIQGFRGNCGAQGKLGMCPSLPNRIEVVSLREVALRKTTCVWFGRIALLSASVLFAGGCVVRIGFASLFDYSFYEVLLLLKWRTAFLPILFRFQYLLSFCSLQGTAVPCTPRQAEPA
ncbi:MAG TPA: hypothetical protein DGP36_04525, partial [Ruminococcus sp.]|nr:hypothetical protein [Ruminococcus sp.]